MANQAAPGRTLIIKKNGTKIAGLRNASYSWNGEPISAKSGDDNGYEFFIDAVSTQKIEVTGELVTKENTWRTLALSGGSKILDDITIELPIVDDANSSPAEISGDFVFTSLQETGNETEAATGNISLSSSGQWTFTPEAV